MTKPRLVKKKRMPCPRNMSDEGKAVWRKLVPRLRDAGLALPVDRFPLQRFCETVAQWRNSLAWLEDHDSSDAGSDGMGC